MFKLLLLLQSLVTICITEHECEHVWWKKTFDWCFHCSIFYCRLKVRTDVEKYTVSVYWSGYFNCYSVVRFSTQMLLIVKSKAKDCFFLLLSQRRWRLCCAVKRLFISAFIKQKMEIMLLPCFIVLLLLVVWII